MRFIDQPDVVYIGNCKYKVVNNVLDEMYYSQYNIIMTYYYNYGQTWEYLDTIFVSKNRKINFLDQSINIHINAVNSYSDTGKPKRFNPKHKTGVSDHFAMVAGIKLN